MQCRSAPQLLLRCCMLTPELYDPGAHTPEGAVYATAFPTPSAISPLIGYGQANGDPDPALSADSTSVDLLEACR